MNLGIYIYGNAEVLDFSGPFEVFSTANRFLNEADGFKVCLIAERSAPVIARGGFSVNPHFNFDNHPELDVLVVVGGIHTEELQKSRVLDWIKKVAGNAKLVASVCTGAFILAEAGVLTNQTVTTHWQDIDDLGKAYPRLTVVDAKRWVDQDKFVTSGGISAGIDMSLHLVSRLADMGVAKKTAKQMEFDWRSNSE